MAAKARVFEVVLGGEQPIEVDPPASREGERNFELVSEKLGRKKRVRWLCTIWWRSKKGRKFFIVI